MKIKIINLIKRKLRLNSFLFKYINNSESINKSELNELFKKYKSLYDTNVQVMYMKPKFLIECTLETGRTHQIRVHMAHIDIHYGFSVNGVAMIHTEILKNSELNHFYKLNNFLSLFSFF